MLSELDAAGFENAVAPADGVTLVEFSAPGCAPCEAIRPVIEQLAGEHGGRLRAYRLDIAEHGETAADAGVRSVPTVILYKSGKPVKTFLGAPSRSDLSAGIAAQLG